MCATSTVIDGWRDPSWPYWDRPHTYPSTTPIIDPAPGINAVPWGVIQQDPLLAQKMLEVLSKLEAIDKRLGQLEKCSVSAREKKNLKARLRRIAKKAQPQAAQ
jgi:hypothetical protein